MDLVLYDDPEIKRSLLPLTFLRPVCDLRVGILSIREKWEKALSSESASLVQGYLSEEFPSADTGDCIVINGAVCPDDELLKALKSLETGTALVSHNTVLAYRLTSADPEQFHGAKKIPYPGEPELVDKVWKIFLMAESQIRQDLSLIGLKGNAKIEDPHTVVYGGENLYIEEGADIKAAILNAESGPIYLGKNSRVYEGAIIHGPFALGEGSFVNIGSKIKGNVTTGPHCRIGGELYATSVQGYSNKGHEGFLGHSVIGQWCNIGADTNTSNLKNNYSSVKLWDFNTESFKDTGQQFCGLIMGDHSKCGINTMFNTGTTVGIGANLFGSGYPRNYIPSFAWGGAHGYMTHKLKKFFETADLAMARRNVEMTDGERKIIEHVYESTRDYRFWEKN